VVKTIFVEFQLEDALSFNHFVEELNQIIGVEGFQAVGDVAVLYRKYYKEVEE